MFDVEDSCPMTLSRLSVSFNGARVGGLPLDGVAPQAIMLPRDLTYLPAYRVRLLQ